MHPSHSVLLHTTPEFDLLLPMTPLSVLEDASSVEGSQSPSQKHRYACTYPGCGKDFSTNGHLTRHYAIHTSTMRYPCTVSGCVKNFSRADSAKYISCFACPKKT
ncbi:hypothetical protein HDU77_006636 [Chytriomyces hyalinus]|nr:hypothetical protein HDU77_006636 [Chytriomyces hyalinus]